MEWVTSLRYKQIALALTVAFALVATSGAVQAGTAHAYSHSVKQGRWKATVSYKRQSGSGRYTMFRKLSVTIRKGRRTVVKRRRVVVENTRSDALSQGRPTWRVTNLDGDSDPEFLLVWRSGCAHSCTRANAFGVGPRNARPILVYLRDGFRVDDLDGNGVAELVGSDFRFSYQFASYASSGQPILIYSLATGAIVDVSRSFPAAIESDAARWLGYWNGGASAQDGGGVALAYAANLCRVGRRAEAEQFLDMAENTTTMPVEGSLDLGYDPDYAEKAIVFLVSVGYC